MVDTRFNTRIRMKIDTTAEWNKATSFIPLKGELIIYSDYTEINENGEAIAVPNIKVGDGLAYVVDLPFVSEDIRKDLAAHIFNTDVHVTSAEKEFWNNKVRCYMNTVEDNDGYLIDGENIIFTTN